MFALPTRLFLVGSISVSLSACTAVIADPAPNGPPEPLGQPSGAPAAMTPEPGADPGEPPVPGGFTVPAEQPVLLPFETRLAKLSAVTGLPTSDPAFARLHENALRLGDYDFANGVVPDSTWTALRISLWVQSLEPVCDSPAITSRFGALPEGLAPFIEAAYGRAMTPDDLAAVDAAKVGLDLDAQQLSRTLCLTLLSATELVIQ